MDQEMRLILKSITAFLNLGLESHGHCMLHNIDHASVEMLRDREYSQRRRGLNQIDFF